jgi:hypothetical protein
MPKNTVRVERRDTTSAGVASRTRFADSLRLLVSLGLSPQAIAYYRRRAAQTGRLPHEVVRDAAEHASRGLGGDIGGFTVSR